jgi:hypothetical protein
MQVRIFGSLSCEKCLLLTNGLKLLGIKYIYIDALDPVNQKLCDKFSVDALPHVQCLDEDEEVVWEKVKSVSITDVYQFKKHYEPQSRTRKSGES